MKLQDFDFRIYDGNKKSYLTEDKLESVGLGIEKCNHIGAFLHFHDDRSIDYYIDNIEIELFTGFMDRNECKIYEGDIIKCWNDNYYEDSDDSYALGSTATPLEESEKHYDYFKIKFDRELGFVSMDLLSLSHILSKYDCVDIVGNIHENPELLGCEK